MKENERNDWSRMGGGGVPFSTPTGIVVSKNITPDRAYGIGDWTDEQIFRAMTDAVSADGRPLGAPVSARVGAMSRLTEQDQRDLVAYLRAIQPQKP